MKKFYYKKSIPQEERPILKQLERSHTLLNALASDVNSKEWHELGVRTRSNANLSESNNYRETISSIGSDDLSPVSSVVITDSDLASSWIYTQKKAAANDAFETESSDAFTPPPQESKTQGQQTEDIESPKLEFKRIPFAPTDETKSSCCCYMSVMLIVFVCSFGILSAVGGIIYLELFTPHKTSVTLQENDAKHSSTTILPILNSHQNKFQKATDNIDSVELTEQPGTDISSTDVLKEPDVKLISSRKGKLLEPEIEDISHEISSGSTSKNTEGNFSMSTVNSQGDATNSVKVTFPQETSEKSQIIDNNQGDFNDDDNQYITTVIGLDQTDEPDENVKEIKMGEAKETTVLEHTESPRNLEQSTDLENMPDHLSDQSITTTFDVANTETDEKENVMYNENRITEATLVVEVTPQQNQNVESQNFPKRHGSLIAPTPPTTDSTTVQMSLGRLQESLGLILKRFQSLEYNSLPYSRDKDGSSVKPPTIDKQLKPKRISTKSSDAEKKQYLDKLRVLMYSS